MSTDHGAKSVADDVLRDAKALVEQAREHEAEQLDLLGVPDPEDIVEARELLGKEAGPLAVLAEARKRGRPKGVRNRRTEDFRKYILGFGQHPAITLMQIQNTPAEVLVERSAAVDPVKRRMSLGDAEQLRTRCAESLLPYIEGKQPVRVDMTVTGGSDLIIEGWGGSKGKVVDLMEAEFADLDDFDGNSEPDQ